VGFVLGLKGRLPSIYTELEVNYFLLRRLLGVKSADGKQAKVAKLGLSMMLSDLVDQTLTRRSQKRNSDGQYWQHGNRSEGCRSQRGRGEAEFDKSCMHRDE